MKKNKSLILSAPYIAWMVIFTLIPLGVVAYYALTDPATGEFSMRNIMELQNYLPVLWQSILYSLISAVISFVRTLICQVAALILLPMIWELDGIWASVVVAEFAALLLAGALFLAMRKRYHYA